LCFQELTDYWTYFEAELSALGYASLYVKRPSLHTSAWSGTDKQDGCLIAYQQNAIARVVDVEQINYDDRHDRVALLVLLQWKEPPPHSSPLLLLATTHLYWDNNKLAVQLHQLDQLMTSINRMQHKHHDAAAGSNSHPIPTVIAGDFNNGPTSQVYSRIVDNHSFQPAAPPSQSAASSSSPDWLYRYDSSYATDGMEPPCTTATHRRCWTIDYIFYSQSATPLLPPAAASASSASSASSPPPAPRPLLRVTHTHPLPSEAELRSEAGPEGWNEDEELKQSGQILHGIPNSQQPSDHVPLFARFEILQPQDADNSK
jgi:mRNA deadenylase 3'-5' endonuclease subunit Ccr4